MKNHILGRDQKGAVVVEASFSLLFFSFAILTIIMMINLYLVHNQMQFALNAVGNEVGTYSYLYHAIGIRGAFKTVASDFSEYNEQVDRAVGYVNQISETVTLLGGGKIDEAKESGEKVKEQTGQIKEDIHQPMNYVKGLAFKGWDWATDQLVNGGVRLLVQAMMKDQEASLENLGASNFQYEVEYPKDSSDLIKISVTYDYFNPFLGWFRPNSKIRVAQEINVAAWFDGDGKEYKGK